MKKALLILAGLTFALCSRPLAAGDEKPAHGGDAHAGHDHAGHDHAGHDHAAHTNGDKPGGDKAMQEMMDAWMKLAVPGEHHKHLAVMAGEWDVAGKMRMMPDAPWTESKGQCEFKPILDGRFVKQKYKGDPMPPMTEPFEGHGLMGYDNYKKKYVCTWVDNMGTMIMMSEGDCTNSGKTITLVGHMPDPMTGKESAMRMVYTLTGPDKFTWEAFCPGMDGKEFKSMELVYSRKKA